MKKILFMLFISFSCFGSQKYEIIRASNINSSFNLLNICLDNQGYSPINFNEFKPNHLITKLDLITEVEKIKLLIPSVSLPIFSDKIKSEEFNSLFIGLTNEINSNPSQTGELVNKMFFGGSNYDLAYGMAIDSSSNVYLGGNTQSTNLSVPNQGSTDAILVKLDPLGNPLWVKSIGGSGKEYIYCVSVDELDNVYVGGSTVSTDGDFSSYPYSGAALGFLRKYDSSGNLLWMNVYGGTGNSSSRVDDIEIKGDHIYITGQLLHGVFVSKIKTDGEEIFSKQFVSGLGQAIAVNSSDEILIGGYTTEATGLFSGHTLSGGVDLFFAKLSTEGEFIWSKVMGSVATDIIKSIVIDNQDNIYGVGSISGAGVNGIESTSFGGSDGIVIKLADDGTKVWDYIIGSSGSESMYEATIISNSLYIGGYTNVGIGGNIESDKIGASDVLVLKISLDGIKQWDRVMGGIGNEWGHAIAKTSSNQIYIGGLSSSTAFGATFGLHDLMAVEISP